MDVHGHSTGLYLRSTFTGRAGGSSVGMMKITSCEMLQTPP